MTTSRTGSPFGRAYAAVLFDMDGTLLDSAASVRRCWLQWAAEHEISVARLRAAARHGVTARDIAAELLPAARVAAAVTRIEDLEVTDVEGTVALPGAAAALAVAGARGAVVTSATTRLARARLAAAGLVSGTAGVLVTADDVERGKPHPEPYLRATELLGVTPADCLVVEDAPAGLRAGRAAGAATLAVTTTHEAAELTGLADAVVGTLADVRLSGEEKLELSAATPAT